MIDSYEPKLMDLTCHWRLGKAFSLFSRSRFSVCEIYASTELLSIRGDL